MGLKQPRAFEEGDMLYLVAPVSPATPTASEIEEFAFGKSIVDDLRQQAPNENLAWFGGHYVEADRPNLNGAMWLSQELAIASLTPVMMPVTVMHDYRSAVGVIAHADLQLPGQGNQARSKIETALALWKHRFPDAVEEAEHNYQQGTLMQSMECHSPDYNCSECGMHFVKLPQKAEQQFWCDHLKASHGGSSQNAAADQNRNASRILRNVTFTGSGLIFGSRGKVGADPEANLSAFQQEVAEFHTASHRNVSRKSQTQRRSTRRMDEITIPKTEYDELQRRPSRQELDDAVKRAQDAEAAAEKAEQEKAAAETAQKAAEEKAEQATAKVTEFEEKANRQSLRDTRWEALGNEFTAKLDTLPSTKANLLRDAESMEDAAWDTRLKEVEETTGLKRDAKKDGGNGGGGGGGGGSEHENAIFNRDEVARYGGGGGESGGTGGPQRQSPGERRSVMSGLTKPKSKTS
jgi:hypothetical protein